jgi:epoxyqueuosine reductase QueG
VPTEEPAFQPRKATTSANLADLLEMTAEEFREKFRKNAVKRAKWSGLLRNVGAALPSSSDGQRETVLQHAYSQPGDSSHCRDEYR